MRGHDWRGGGNQTYSKIALGACILLSSGDGGANGLPNGMFSTGPRDRTIPPKQLVASIGDSRRGGSGDALGLLVGVALEFDGHDEVSRAGDGEYAKTERVELHVSG